MRVGSITFTTNGDRITATFSDEETKDFPILNGRSLNDCQKAISQLLLIMQHRNGILNYKPDGSMADKVKEDLIPEILSLMIADEKKMGWGDWCGGDWNDWSGQ